MWPARRRCFSTRRAANVVEDRRSFPCIVKRNAPGRVSESQRNHCFHGAILRCLQPRFGLVGTTCPRGAHEPSVANAGLVSFALTGCGQATEVMMKATHTGGLRVAVTSGYCLTPT